jgi:hypothetical protein
MPKPPRVQDDEPDLFSEFAYRVGDAVKLVEAQYDAVICDPPYGFNTEEEFWHFGEVIRQFVRSAILSLRPTGGQLLFACPQISFSGREIMPFVRGDFLTREILRIAAAEGRECFSPSFASPNPTLSARPPYYWVAEKTLRRSVLHFWIREKH